MRDASSTTSNAEIARCGPRPKGGSDKGVSATFPLLDDTHRIALVAAPCTHTLLAPIK